MDATLEPALPPPDVVRRAAAEVISRPHYRLGEGGDEAVSTIERLYDFFARLLRPLSDAFAALFEASPFLALLLLVGLLVLLVVLVAHIAYSIKAALREPKPTPLGALEDPADLIPETWERRSREAAECGDFMSAVRFLFRACLVRLTRARKEPFRRAATNREYLRHFEGTDARDHLATFVELIDIKWYAGGDSTEMDYEQCLSAHEACGRMAKDISLAQRA